MKDNIECALCDGVAALHQEERSILYRKKEINVPVNFYKCQKCGEQFTTDELDAVTMNTVQSKYNQIIRIW